MDDVPLDYVFKRRAHLTVATAFEINSSMTVLRVKLIYFALF